jgi:uncharacterized protein
MDDRLKLLEPEASFRFTCSPEVPCFNECCRDLNQVLTPYDVLRLKRRLGISSRGFLEHYTRHHAGPESGLPVVSLKPVDPRRLSCPFVTTHGCRVYPDRPSSCRTYPLVRVLRRSRETGRMTEAYLLLREPHCMGFEQAGSQTAGEWMAAQQVTDYNTENDRLLEIISIKNRLAPGRLPQVTADLVYMALYDADRFRSRVLGRSLPHASGLEPDEVAAARDDDLLLLRLGLKWVKRLFEG